MFETTHYIQGSVKGLRATFLSITMETRGGMTIESTGGGGISANQESYFEQTIFHK